MGSNFQRRATFRREVLIASESRWARRKTRVPDKLVPDNGDSCDANVHAFTLPQGRGTRVAALRSVTRPTRRRLPSSPRRVAAFRTALPPPSLLKYAKTSLPAVPPLADPVRPPAQVVVRVGAAVQVVVVRAVQPDVDERGGGAQDAGQTGAAHHAVRRAVPFQQGVDVVRRPSSDGGTRRATRIQSGSAARK